MVDNIIFAAGPIIIEHGKILLNREIKRGNIESPFFMLPGGKLQDITEHPQDACRREAKEELNIDIEIIRPLETLIVERPDAPNSYAVLFHYLAKRIHPEKDIIPPTNATVEWGWFDIHDLPKNCTPSIPLVIEAYLNEQAL